MDWDTPVTLFIFNLASTLPDTFIIRILRLCGTVLRWRRATGVKENPYDFGFVDYASPNEALQALRVIPQIVILEKTWQAKLDKSQQGDLLSFEQARKMRADFDEEKELKNDQLILRMIDELVSSSAFARSVPRLTDVLFSENDDSRTSEHYKYLNEIHRENDMLEERFRDDLIAWRATEVRLESDREAMRKSIETDCSDRQQRDSFLREWKPPEIAIGDPESEANFVRQWKEFMRIRRERLVLRAEEEEFERLLSNDVSFVSSTE
jgi:hypothetical protein